VKSNLSDLSNSQRVSVLEIYVILPPSGKGRQQGRAGRLSIWCNISRKQLSY